MVAEASVRHLIAEACRILAHAGLADDILGHVSLRTANGLAVRCRGEKEAGLLFTQPRDVHEVTPLAVLPPDYQAPNELPIHTEILAARPDVQAVVHAHPPFVVAADLAGIALRPVIGAYNIPAMRLAAERIPIYGRSVLISTAELGRDLAQALGSAPAVLLRGHGIVTVGATVQEAVVRALNIEILAKMLVRASARGTVDYEVDIDDRATMPDLGTVFNDLYVWQYQRERLRHSGLAISV